MPGHLFAEYFLTEGIRATDEWRASVSDAAAFDAFRDGVRQRYDALSRSADPNEAVTEQELIRPVLELLGWADYLPQQGAARNEDIPDLLLFPDAASKERAAARGSAEAEIPGRHRRRREQAARPGSRCPQRGGRTPVQDASRPDTQVPVDGRSSRRAGYGGAF